MPSPLRSGCSYTIALGNGKKVTFLYDEMRTVSRAIKVNQVGYLPDAPRKYAYLGCHLNEHGPMDLSQVRRFQVDSAISRSRDLGQVLAVVEEVFPLPGPVDRLFRVCRCRFTAVIHPFSGTDAHSTWTEIRGSDQWPPQVIEGVGPQGRHPMTARIRSNQSAMWDVRWVVREALVALRSGVG